MIDLIMSNQWYVLYLAIVMIISGYVKDLGLLVPVYTLIKSSVKSNRMIVFLLSCVTGVLPIPGRVTVSAGVLNTIAPKDKAKREIYGIIDYLSTHHYYLWSPLEKSVILPMAALGISYIAFLEYMLPLLLMTFIVIFYFIFFVLSENDVEIEMVNNDSQKVIEKNPFNYLNFHSLIFLFFIIILSNYARTHTEMLYEYVSYFSNSFALISVVAFMSSLALGSSSRFAAITVLCTGIYGIEYLPWFFVIDYAGYMLSPAHKCFYIGKSYFNTKLVDYLIAISILLLSLVIVSVIMSFV
tara:strand:- start:47 stop:940 length:894 start_codon:yes stop_codon:yes gene_type:complete